MKTRLRNGYFRKHLIGPDRLWAQTAPFAQLHPQVQVLEVVVVLPHRRLRLGPDQLPRPLEAFLTGVHWLSLEELGQKPGLDPLVSLLTLPVLPRPDIPGATEQILHPRRPKLKVGLHPVHDACTSSCTI